MQVGSEFGNHIVFYRFSVFVIADGAFGNLSQRGEFFLCEVGIMSSLPESFFPAFGLHPLPLFAPFLLYCIFFQVFIDDLLAR